jgi:hypothetical protein
MTDRWRIRLSCPLSNLFSNLFFATHPSEHPSYCQSTHRIRYKLDALCGGRGLGPIQGRRAEAEGGTVGRGVRRRREARWAGEGMSEAGEGRGGEAERRRGGEAERRTGGGAGQNVSRQPGENKFENKSEIV